ncbi:hypothetical protein CGRA01v4_12944 [Colletotrichum graminicola]|uniref:C2H2-type domain-containing protein n=1 Tax=Colletotrichum graminicola (strain M1.001 / M2 / FGSC 10212) TaxID=645133 RepID=E3QJ36_COLGM|nr:uncharacterized protein GLRG_06018 [Colletotrichum graminicola M1.001]EFQ30874.1 hypothetical protein GLRG_06018 [Colletotrichum graminicola M1.001]WDK21654.1 hypothetical protein CGRA01v4_12944 [Colletotrichum graminicola]
MVAEEVLLDSEAFCSLSLTHKVGTNSNIGFQERKDGPQRRVQGPYACEICNKCYNKKHELNRHMKHHIKPEVCKSKGCGHRCADPSDLDRHEQVYHSSEKRRFKCNKCPKGFTRSDNLTRHRKNSCKR